MALAVAHFSSNRSAVLGDALRLYGDFARATAQALPDKRAHIEAAYEEWMPRLSELLTLRVDVAVPFASLEAFEALRNEVVDPVDDEARLRWMDLYPETLLRIFASPFSAIVWASSAVARGRAVGITPVA